MTTQYHRPQTIEEAIRLLSLPGNRAMGGGTILNQPSNDSFSVVDLQKLGLDTIQVDGQNIKYGSTTSLQLMLENQFTPQVLKNAIQHDIPINLRNMATIGGTIATSDGRSPFLTALLALDPLIFLAPGNERISLGDLLPLRDQKLEGKIITYLTFFQHINLEFELVSRTPMDKPIICVALGKWSSGRTRVVLGGWGKIPRLAMDGKLSPMEATEILEKVVNSTVINSTDEWASEDYRRGVAGILVKRCWENSITNKD